VTPAALAVFCFGLVVIVAAALFVAAPLFRPALAAPASDAGSERERWERQKRQAVLAIKEAELDHQMGKLSDEDFGRMRERFERQALEAIAALERGGGRG
jgi:hypothetical protein